jgi:hypothetical protein
LRKWIAFYLFFALLPNAWARAQGDSEVVKGQTIKDYFQPLLTGVKYQYDSLLYDPDTNFDLKNKKSKYVKNSTVEFLKSEESNDGIVEAIYKNEVYLGDMFGSVMPAQKNVFNTFTYLIDAESIQWTRIVNSDSPDADAGDETQFNNYYLLKMPRKDMPVEWANVDQFGNQLDMKAYFGKCKTLSASYPDCIIVEEQNESTPNKMSRDCYAKSVGLVKSEDLLMNRESGKYETSEWGSYQYLSKIEKESFPSN